MIYALLSRNFVVKIYALFPQDILDKRADSANFLPLGCMLLGRAKLGASLAGPALSKKGPSKT